MGDAMDHVGTASQAVQARAKPGRSGSDGSRHVRLVTKIASPQREHRGAPAKLCTLCVSVVLLFPGSSLSPGTYANHLITYTFTDSIYYGQLGPRGPEDPATSSQSRVFTGMACSGAKATPRKV